VIIDYQALFDALRNTPLAPWLETLPAQIAEGLSEERHGDLRAWKAALALLPQVNSQTIDLNTAVKIGALDDCDEQTRTQIRHALELLIPWRKGPYWVHGVHIDTGWRSDGKGGRGGAYLAPLNDGLVWAVGCGNGEHCWRVRGAGARWGCGVGR